MNRIVSFMAGAVSALAVVAGSIGVIAAATAQPQPQTVPNVIAEQFGVEVHWFTEGEPIPCGDGVHYFGCADPDIPDVIYVRSGLPEDVTQSVILHEIGHVMQYRLGLPPDEESATDFACSLGAARADYNC